MRKFIIVCIIFLSQSVFGATYHAVVVGVSDYPMLEPSLSLDGPKYDVLRVRSMLLQQGVEQDNIRLLADGVEDSALPTKQNILEAIFDVEDKIVAGDFVYLHFSGHGSQQPVKVNDTSDETVDGLDEIFLPRDVSYWSRSRGEVPNSLTDNEISIITNRLRNKGANVWVIFDSCHSGTMTRSVTGQNVRSRNVSFDNLSGVSETSEKAENARAEGTHLEYVELKAEAGALISFGAAQSNEEAPEMLLSNGDSKSPQGLFTHTMTSLISQSPNLSYRQLAQGILSAYNSLPWYRTTPLFEGSDLDTPIFHRSGDVHVRYPIRDKGGRYVIQAGQLNGLELGATVEIFADVTSQEPLAVMEITTSGLATSEAELRSGELTSKRAFAQLLNTAYPAAITFKWQEQPDEEWQKALDIHLSNNDFLKRTIDWVGENQNADVSLYVGAERLYFFTLANLSLPCELDSSQERCKVGQKADSSQETYLSLNIDGQSAFDTLNNGLIRMVRAQNLKRLSAKMTGATSVQTEVYLNDEPIDLHTVIAAENGDSLYMSFANQSRKPVDLTVMFVDSGQGITQIFPEPGYSGRLFAGEFAEFEGEISSEETKGEEQFIVIAVPASREAPQLSLAHLQQEPLEGTTFEQRAKTKSRSLAGSHEDLFAQALGDLPQQRAFKKRNKFSGRASISVIRLKSE